MPVAFVAIVLPLVATVVIETGVAAAFGLRRRGLGAVVSLNLVTNPLLNLLVIVLLGFGAGYATGRVGAGGSGLHPVVPAPWVWAALALLEVVVIVAEWRGLIWALGRRSPTSRRLLSVSVAMNVASATLGTFLLVHMV